MNKNEKLKKDKRKNENNSKKNKDGKLNKVNDKKDYKKMMQEYLEGWKRCKADFENYRKRKEEEKQDNLRYAKENLILELLPVLDNFNSATIHIPETEKNSGWVEGIMYIKKQLEDLLRENGVEEINIKSGDKFDEKFCEAIKDENKKENEEKDKKDNQPQSKSLKIKKVLVKGYRLGEKVIRPAKVIVDK